MCIRSKPWSFCFFLAPFYSGVSFTSFDSKIDFTLGIAFRVLVINFAIFGIVSSESLVSFSTTSLISSQVESYRINLKSSKFSFSIGNFLVPVSLEARFDFSILSLVSFEWL